MYVERYIDLVSRGARWRKRRRLVGYMYSIPCESMLGVTSRFRGWNLNTLTGRDDSWSFIAAGRGGIESLYNPSINLNTNPLPFCH